MRSSLVAALLAIGLPAGYFFWHLPGPKLTGSERELIAFPQAAPVLPPPGHQVSFAGLACPVRVIPGKAPLTGRPEAKGLPLGPLGPLPPPPAGAAHRGAAPHSSLYGNPNVSMIYSDASNKSAIIDGQVVHEGSPFGKNLILRIEQTRVLMRTAQRDIWLSID